MEHVDMPLHEPQPDTVPLWVLQEVGRLHLDNLALRRELDARDQQEEPT